MTFQGLPAAKATEGIVAKYLHHCGRVTNGIGLGSETFVSREASLWTASQGRAFSAKGVVRGLMVRGQQRAKGHAVESLVAAPRHRIPEVIWPW
jgi:hypothetical protein